MTPTVKLVCLSATLCTAAALAQSPRAASGFTAPAAYVYVTSVSPETGATEIYAFSAGADGKLTAVPGSPFADTGTNTNAVPTRPSGTAWNNGTSAQFFQASFNPDSEGGAIPGGPAHKPKAAVAQMAGLSVALSGKMLAVGGMGGLQIFAFNDAGTIMPHSGLLTREDVDQVYWDNHHHLYAVGQKAGKVWVFTVTPLGAVPAPGSPYAVSDATNLIVQPWPWD